MIADDLRDLVLPDLGVRMEDQGSGIDVVTKWKLDDPEAMRKERALKEEAKLEKVRQKEETARKQREKEEKMKIPPAELFIGQTDLYSVFDKGTGMPTHDNQGEPLAKAATKKLQVCVRVFMYMCVYVCICAWMYSREGSCEEAAGVCVCVNEATLKRISVDDWGVIGHGVVHYTALVLLYHPSYSQYHPTPPSH